VNALYSDDLMAKYYSKGSQTSNVCSEVTKTLSNILESLQTSGKKSIKILEAGAGLCPLVIHPQITNTLRQRPDF
jgi:hypothetical protein